MDMPFVSFNMCYGTHFWVCERGMRLRLIKKVLILILCFTVYEKQVLYITCRLMVINNGLCRLSPLLMCCLYFYTDTQIVF